MLRIGVITVSDRVHAGRREDESGLAIRSYVERKGDCVASYAVVPDEVARIEEALLSAADERGSDVVFTTGGTGFAPRDVTPEATRRVIEREAPGIAEVIRLESLKKTRRAMLSRGVAGIRGRTLIVNLPGSARAVVESLDAIYDQLEHAVAILRERPTDH